MAPKHLLPRVAAASITAKVVDDLRLRGEVELKTLCIGFELSVIKKSMQITGIIYMGLIEYKTNAQSKKLKIEIKTR